VISRRFVVIASLLVLVMLAVGSRLPAVGWQALAWPGRWLTNTLRVLSDVGGFHRLRAERDELRAQVAALTQQVTDAQEAAKESRRLHELLELRSASVPSLTVARVIGRSPWPWAQAIVLDRGRQDGVAIDAPVVVPAGLVGRVAEADERTSRALLLTDPNFRAGVILERSRQEGLLTGTPTGECLVTYLPLEADVQPGDLVLTAGISPIFPRGVRVGQIVSVKEDPSRSYRIARLRPAAALSSLEEVGCLSSR